MRVKRIPMPRFFASVTPEIFMRRSGQNVGGYRGETIDIHKVLIDSEKAAAAADWVCDRQPCGSDGAASPAELIFFRRPVPSPRRRLYVSTGIHGDEPAGPMAALQLLREDQWPADFSLWLCPCLNPTGFPLNRRENAGGIDLNRDYRHFQSVESRTHAAWLAGQPAFDLTLCLHEDWESHGFYLYELNPDHRPSLAEHIIDKVSAVCPVDPSPVIENWPAQNGIIRPVFNPEERPLWPEAIYMAMQKKTRQSYTVEAPSDFPLQTRIAALVTAVRAVLQVI